MSRVGKKPILIPHGVDVAVVGQHVSVKGPKGQLERNIHPFALVSIEDVDAGKQVVVRVEDKSDRLQAAQWGTARSVISNMVSGVNNGFAKELEVNGVGYRVSLQGNVIILNVGFSHEVRFALPDGITASVEGNKITLSGPNKELVGEFAANIRKVRKPEPYKGKGIKYVDEVIRRKAGKSQKSGDK
jgi:large subunit ribosomal protein L6